MPRLAHAFNSWTVHRRPIGYPWANIDIGHPWARNMQHTAFHNFQVCSRRRCRPAARRRNRKLNTTRRTQRARTVAVERYALLSSRDETMTLVYFGPGAEFLLRIWHCTRFAVRVCECYDLRYGYRLSYQCNTRYCCTTAVHTAVLRTQSYYTWHRCCAFLLLIFFWSPMGVPYGTHDQGCPWVSLGYPLTTHGLPMGSMGYK